MEGIVYFLTNKSMPGLLKIGFTLGLVEERLKQLNTTSVPLPFDIATAYKVKNAEECEKSLHCVLETMRISDKREFFKISLQEALKITLPVILEYLEDNLEQPIIEKEIKPNHDLDDSQIAALQKLAYNGRISGISLFNITIYWGYKEYEDHLKMEYKMAILKEKGLVEELRKGKERENFWRITSKGIKFLFENKLVPDRKSIPLI